MTTQDIANRYYELTVAWDYDTINSELYSNDIISIEPDGSFLPSTSGMDAKNAKSQQFHDSMEEMIGWYTNEPIVAGKFFACAMWMEAKFKENWVMKIDEMAVFECKDGKIVKETFFF